MASEHHPYEDPETYLPLVGAEVDDSSVDPDADKGILAEVGIVVLYAIPAFTSCIAQFSLGLIDVIFIGRLDKKFLAAAALGNVWSESTLMFCVGVLNAMDTLIPQAFGAGNKKMVGDVLQVSLVVSLMMSIPLGLLWWFTEPVLLLFGQEAVLAERAGGFCRAMIPGVPFALWYQSFTKFLQGQGTFLAPLVVTVVCIGLNVLFNWLFIYHYEMGFHGAPWATTASRFCMFILILVALVVFKGYKTMTCPSIAVAFNPKGLYEFLALGIPSGFLLGSEQWGIDILTVAAGWLGSDHNLGEHEDYLAAHSVGVNVINTTLMVPLGISIAASIRVGHLVGASKLGQARRSGVIAVGLALLISAVSAGVLFVFSREVGKIFMEDNDGSERVLSLIEKIIPIAAAFQIFDGVQCAMGGVLRGMGRPGSTFFVFVVGFYCLGIPLAMVMAFPLDLKLEGIWWGLTVGLFSVASGMILLWALSDWNKVHAESQLRTGTHEYAAVAPDDEVLQEEILTRSLAKTQD